MRNLASKLQDIQTFYVNHTLGVHDQNRTNPHLITARLRLALHINKGEQRIQVDPYESPITSKSKVAKYSALPQFNNASEGELV